MTIKICLCRICLAMIAASQPTPLFLTTRPIGYAWSTA